MTEQNLTLVVAVCELATSTVAAVASPPAASSKPRRFSSGPCFVVISTFLVLMVDGVKVPAVNVNVSKIAWRR